MIKLNTFEMHDKFNTPRRTILKYAMESAKADMGMYWCLVRCVAIVDTKPYVSNRSERLIGILGLEEDYTVYTIDVWGHELEIPDSAKHWTEKLDKHIDSLTIGEGWAE
jgi:hypothetical protein